MLHFLRESFRPNSASSLGQRFEEIITAPVLILDDLGALHGTAWVREQLFILFDHRYRSKLPTVITTYEYIADMFLGSFDVPEKDINRTVGEALKIIRDNSIEMFGYSSKGILDARRTILI